MTQINDEFMEAYKHLDKICREIFSAEKGVTTYIDEMREISDGSRFVSSWNNVLNRLIQLRKIRNDYAHEVGNLEVTVGKEHLRDIINDLRFPGLSFDYKRFIVSISH